MKTERVLIYKDFERFWHWSQAMLILFLAFTGFEVHGTFQFLGYRHAVVYHRTAAVALLVLTAFAVFWHFTTGEWRQYMPTRKLLGAQIEFYVSGIFRGAPHPANKTRFNKLNPIQRIVYLGLKILVMPVMAISGLLYLFYRFPRGSAPLHLGGLETVALFHTAGAFLLVAFVVAHAYLITTGHTPLTNLKAMIGGYEDLETDAAREIPAEPARSAL